MSKRNKISNQKKEKHYFEKFKSVYCLPPGEVIYGDSPDVIINGQRKIGIEITNFYLEEGSSSKSEQAQIRLREKVVSSAQQDYQNGNKRKIEITFGFDKTRPIQDKRDLSENLVELAKKIEKRDSGKVGRAEYGHIPELSFVYLNANEYEDAKWRVCQCDVVPVMSRDRLLEIVKDKEKRAKSYSPCDAYWLLVVVDFIDPAQDQEIQNDDFEKIQTEMFEKIIVYKTLYDHVLEAK